jgi:hypothetical protein
VEDYFYNSCRNRHCPKCQHNQKKKWIEQRKKELLPVNYFHLVFTIPRELNQVFIRNKVYCYHLLFRSVWQTIKEFGNNPRWLGAQTGGMALIHTWGQNLSYHPHIHFILPSGGLAEDKFEWISTHKKFFAPVWAMAERFKELLLDDLLKQKQELELTNLDQAFEALMQNLREKKWIVFSQASFSNPDCVIDYLGNYTHKIAISNHRLLKIENDHVFFNWKDYKDSGKQKVMSLHVFEFIRRFLDHVLPHNFYKIRYYGILSNRYKMDNVTQARACLLREGKKVRLKEDKNKSLVTVPQGCTYMGPCKSCKGVTISLEQYKKTRPTQEQDKQDKVIHKKPG